MHRMAIDVMPRLWRGEVPLSRTCFLYGWLGIVGLSIPLFVMRLSDLDDRIHQMVPVIFFMTLTLLAINSGLVLAYASFIGVAIWRSAERYCGPMVYRVFAKSSVLIVLFQVIYGFVANFHA